MGYIALRDWRTSGLPITRDRSCGKRRGSLVLALALVPPALCAQQQDTLATLAPGARVRVTAPSGWHIAVGQLVSIDSARIAVRRDNDTLTVPREVGTRLDVSAGPGQCSGNRGGCVVVGLLGGAAAGALVGWLDVTSRGGAHSTNCQENLCELIYWFSIPIGTVVGTVLGAVVGGEH